MTMAHQELIHEELITLLGYQPRHIMDGMIKTKSLKLPDDNEKRPNRTTGPLGKLDHLPLELLHMIISMVDLRTLVNISQTCSRGTAVVRSLRQYRDLIKYAAPAMAALGWTQLLRYHSANALHAALLSRQCASCGRFGAFLLLTTCIRCCFECLCRNQSLWVVPVGLAKKCFRLPASFEKRLAVMHSIPGRYWVRHTISRQRRIRLVSVASAKALAMEEGISEQSLAHDLEAQRAAGLCWMKFQSLRWLQMAPLQPPGPELAERPIESNRPNDAFCGMASIPFPSLSPGACLDTGLWCRGCEYIFRNWSHGTVIPDAVARLIPAGALQWDALFTLQHVARSRTEFLDHIKLCVGAEKLAHDQLAKLRQMEKS